MSKDYKEYVGYEFIGGSRDGNLADLDELSSEIQEGDAWAVWTENTDPPVSETYIVTGRKLMFSGYVWLH